ncbi:MAG TPA: glycine betaine ABC transporter substrate-binding protein [Steroidobacteraceae bacterium]|jgi:osmoprotectant transport system permease protein
MPAPAEARGLRVPGLPGVLRALGLLLVAALIGGGAPSADAMGAAGAARAAFAGPTASVGSKNFTESLILADLLQLEAQRRGLTLVHRRAMGGSAILWQALLAGSIDAYPEYTGTLRAQLLPGLAPTAHDAAGEAALRATLARAGVLMGPPLGFEDRYALAVPSAIAQRLHLASLSDLRAHPELRYALSNEFMDRADGWPGLRRVYGLAPRSVRGLDHSLAYRALREGAAEVVDVYTTDAQIAAQHLTVLKDDRHFFPRYDAVWLYRRDAAVRWPALAAAINALAGRISVQSMQRLNAAVQLQHRDDREVAAAFYATLAPGGSAAQAASSAAGSPAPAPAARGTGSGPGSGAQLLARTREHLLLVGISLALALAIGLPLGVLGAQLPALGRPLLALSAVMQTIPSLALLVFMIPLFGIGARPAIAALFLYSLLPIVRNTLTGLASIPAPLVLSAAALGLPRHVRLLRVELPLAARTIIAGISTAAVINVGTATLGALIGAGGYGEPILTGIRLDDVGLILRGAVPAAVLALLVMGAFQLLERAVTPRGLRQFREP